MEPAFIPGTFEQPHPIVNGLNPHGFIGNTLASSKHYINVYCAKCDRLLADADSIYRIKDGCFWVTRYTANVSMDPKVYFNHKKQTKEAKAFCAKCSTRIGNIYPGEYKSSAAPHYKMAAKFFPCQTGTTRPATKWEGDPARNTPEPIEFSAPSGLVRCEMEEKLVREAADLGLIEYSQEYVKILRDANIFRMRLVEGASEEETEQLRQLRHVFLKYKNVKTGVEDWEHTPFVVLIASFGLNEEWAKFISDVSTLHVGPQGLKAAHKTVEAEVLTRLECDREIQKLRSETKQELLKRLERSLNLPADALAAEERLPVKDLYSSDNLTISEERKGRFISLDMKSSNFNILRLLNGTLGKTSWEDLLVECAAKTMNIHRVKFVAQNKSLRVKILGKVIPKRIKFCQYALMSHICDKLMQSGLNMSEMAPFLFSCDEIIIPCSENLAEDKARVEAALAAAFPRQLVELMRCTAVTLREYDFSEEMIAKMSEKTAALAASGSLSNPTTPVKATRPNGGWSELEDQTPDEFTTPNLSYDKTEHVEKTTFFVRFDENADPQLKGIPYHLRFSAMKQAKLFDPARAFKKIAPRQKFNPAKKPCHFYQLGRCKRGAACNYAHIKL